MNTDAQAPRRGRPVSADPVAIGLTALHLFVERGLDNVTMDEVAAASGVSRRTLFRVFPTKASIVWGGMAEFMRELESQLDVATGDNAVALLHQAWVGALHTLDDATEITRLRMLLIAQSAEAEAWGHSRRTEASRILERHITRIDGSPEATLRARLLAAALMAAGFSALVWWAQSDDPRSAADVIDESFDELEQMFRSAT